MTDWQPLADEDPLPGDPAEVESLATRLGTIGTDVAANTPTLRAVQTQDAWSGEAAHEFTTKVGDLPDKLDKVGTRFGSIAAALRDYAPVLREAQADARAALAVAHQAQAAATRAQVALNGLATARDAGTPEPPAQTSARAQEAARYRGEISTANEDLARARRMLTDAVGKHRDAEKRAATRIADAADDDLQNPRHKLLHKLGRGLHKALKGVSKVAGWVAMGAGVLALATCWIPGVDIVTSAIAMYTGAIALGVDALLMPFGDMSWKQLGMDALGVIPGGKVFEGAALAKNGVRVFEAAGGAGRLVSRGLKLSTGMRIESAATRLGAGISHAGGALTKEWRELGGAMKETATLARDWPLARQAFRNMENPWQWLHSQYTTARDASRYGGIYRSAGLAYDATAAILPLPWPTGSAASAPK